MIIMGNDPAHSQSLKALLQRQFKMKDLNLLWYFLGIEIAYGPSGFPLSQHKYTTGLIPCAILSDDTPADTPM